MADGRRAVLAALLTVAVTAGCGVSATRRPADLGDAAVAGSFGGAVKEPSSPDAALDAVSLVTLYLQAGIGENEQAVERVRKFFARGASWTPGSGLTIVRLVDRTSRTQRGDEILVTVNLQRIGTMSSSGAVDLFDTPSPVTQERFTVVGQGTPTQWRLRSAPPGLMISDTTLESLYQPSPVYFWDRERMWLVPDLRYVPLNLPVSERLNQLVEWQLSGPSPWLRNSVSFRTGIKLKERVVARDDGVIVNLTGATSDDPGELQRLADQIRWTLRAPMNPGGTLATVERSLELRIEGLAKEITGAGDRYLGVNAAAASRAPALFTIGPDGKPDAKKVVPDRGPNPYILTAKANANVKFAGISADPYNLAAFVDLDRPLLTIARVGTSEQDQGKIKETPITRLPAPIGRPVWIPGSREQFLVPARGKLYVVDPRSSPRPVTLSVRGGVTSVSVSPDGRRVALVAGGRAFVGALAVERGGSVEVGPQLLELVPRRLTVAAVAWASEAKVLVAGSTGANRAALFRATADGAVAVDESRDEAALTDVIASPARTGGGSGVADIVAQTEEAVFYVFSNDTVNAGDLIRPFYAG